jgi:RNA polymerase sigma factor (sigma-70 family)
MEGWNMPIFRDNRKLLRDLEVSGHTPETDSSGWKETLTRARPVLRRYLASRLPTKAHAHLVDDLVQEVCLRALSAGRPHFSGTPLPYLLGIAHHLIVDHHRRKHRELLVDDVASVSAEPTASLEDNWVLGDLTESVSKALTKASKHERELFYRLVFLQESQRNAAIAFGLTRKQVRSLLQRLRARLDRTLRPRHSAPNGHKKSTADRKQTGPSEAHGPTTTVPSAQQTF